MLCYAMLHEGSTVDMIYAERPEMNQILLLSSAQDLTGKFSMLRQAAVTCFEHERDDITYTSVGT